METEQAYRFAKSIIPKSMINKINLKNIMDKKV